MNRNQSLLILILIALLLASLAGTAAMAQESKNYRIGWYAISRGGGYSGSGAYELAGSTGELLDHSSPPSSDNYVVRRGPWEALPAPYKVYLPVVLRH